MTPDRKRKIFETVEITSLTFGLLLALFGLFTALSHADDHYKRMDIVNQEIRGAL